MEEVNFKLHSKFCTFLIFFKKKVGYLAFQKAKIEKFLSWLFQKAGLGSRLPSLHKTHV